MFSYKRNDYFISAYVTFIFVTAYFIGDYYVLELKSSGEYYIFFDNPVFLFGGKITMGLLPSFIFCSICIYILILIYSLIYGISKRSEQDDEFKNIQ